MKKIMIMIAFCSLYSCNDKPQPIDKYRNKGIVVISIKKSALYDQDVRCKTKDSIFYIRLTPFDHSTLNVGDTIK
jgi:hypothetical protein